MRSSFLQQSCSHHSSTFKADDAANYGGIGAVIGHEIGHGFDDQGSKYDGDGNLNNWWTDLDREEFEKRAAKLIAQYEELHPLEAPDVHVNGALTIGENIGDSRRTDNCT